MAKTNPKVVARKKRARRIRTKISGTAECPRLSVFRSNRHIYAQLVDDVACTTLASAASDDKEFDGAELKGKCEKAKRVGELIAKRALAAGVEQAVFDRGGNLYHGRVKALSDGAREGGLKF
ncbi:MAG: 50S ribosomal protein L18 [Desulfobulbus propionicus]|nr:MAG: 50S ribosomal protein L18 [Desulfobulbus propionicus]